MAGQEISSASEAELMRLRLRIGMLFQNKLGDQVTAVTSEARTMVAAVRPGS